MSSVGTVRRFRGLQVLVLGDAMLDSYLEGSATRLCSEGPVPVVRRTLEEHAPGGAANAAANVQALGADVRFVGLVGDDPAASILRQSLRQHRVDDTWLVTDPAVTTLHKQRILADDQYVVRYDSGDTRSPSKEAQERLLQRLNDAFATCDAVLLSDYRYGALTDAMITRLQTLRRRERCPLVIDSKALHRFAGCGATIITPNHLEARLAVDPSSAYDGSIDLDEIARLAQHLLQAIASEYVAVTLAAHGALLLGRDLPPVHLPARYVPHANDVGAGDSFAAALTLALAAGASVCEGVQIGIAAAGIAVARRRTAIVHHQELLQRASLDSQPAPPLLETLRSTLDAARGEGRRVVFTNGVFDILHAGHIHFLRQARELGDILVVGVNSDASARRLKGENRPINSEGDRLALVAALEPVDHAVLFDEDDPIQLIRTLRPDIHVKGGDYAGADLPEAAAVREIGGEMVILPLYERFSTSSVIDRILALAGSRL